MNFVFIKQNINISLAEYSKFLSVIFLIPMIETVTITEQELSMEMWGTKAEMPYYFNQSFFQKGCGADLK